MPPTPKGSKPLKAAGPAESDSSATRQAQHTPGPWSVEAREGMPGREVRAGATYVVAVVSTTSNDESNRLANARLIAAAPDLLAALEQLLQGFEHLRIRDGSGELQPLNNPIIDRARAAIRQAKGDNL